MPNATCEAMNQSQSIRASSAGLISLKVAQMSADHRSGETRLLQNAVRRDGSIGSNTAKGSPTSRDITPWMITATTKAVLSKAVNCARSAFAKEGSAAAASRLIGYHTLRYATRP